VDAKRKKRPKFPLDHQWANWDEYHKAKRRDLTRSLYHLAIFQQGCAWLGNDAYVKYKIAEKAMNELRAAVTVKALRERG